MQKQPTEGLEPEFIWIDCTLVLNRAEQWQHEIYQHSQLSLNEYHVRDILNIEHPCAFDTLDDYDLLIFRKLITPEDRIATEQQVGENMNGFWTGYYADELYYDTADFDYGAGTGQ